MEVTTANFGELKERIIHQIEQSAYITFDLEFTGLRYEKFERDYINLLPFEKYKKLKYVAETYQILQLGVSLVVFDKKLKVYPYNFYLFPRNPTVYDRNINMQLGCLKFNADNGMDWNKWIREGVNYIQLAQKHEIERGIEKQLPVKETLNALTHENQVIAHRFLEIVQKVSQGELPSPQIYQIHRFNNMQRQLVSIFHKFIKEEGIDVSLEEKEDSLVLKQVTREKRSELEEKKKDEVFGFSLIFEHIWKSKKRIVGHNCFLDLMYLYHNFIQPLPENYFQYKKILSQSGNSFYDTKYIALQNPTFNSGATRLEDLVKLLREDQNATDLHLDEQYSDYSLDNPNLHEAGYDSYITAWVFQQFLRIEDNMQKKGENKLNLNNSFFFVNLAAVDDQINIYYAQNVLRVYVDAENNDEVRDRRAQEVKRVKAGLKEFDQGKDYQIYEGYREIFIEIKDKREQLLTAILSAKIKDIKTFPTYLRWQIERLKKIGTNGGNYKKVRVIERVQKTPEEVNANRASDKSDQSDKSDKSSAEKIQESPRNFDRVKRG